MGKRDAFIICGELRQPEGRNKLCSLNGDLQSSLNLGAEFSNLIAPRNFPETADADRHWMHRSAADERHQLVTDSLQFKALANEIRLVGGQGNCIVHSEEIGSLQQIDMERMALNPLRTIKQPPQRSHISGPGVIPNADSMASTDVS